VPVTFQNDPKVLKGTIRVGQDRVNQLMLMVEQKAPSITERNEVITVQ
jgi:hypothetical protein